ncbi:hypothetical protein HU200_039260 [Digitaria exilis]|uniref:Ubiquitin-like domain-containing protein n=4 Tax=PACMAD clade TaxID=147370 RepID=A0A835BB35_9POAL|nr:hypothetical protein HU200_039260 [Digitaria exilis]
MILAFRFRPTHGPCLPAHLPRRAKQGQERKPPRPPRPPPTSILPCSPVATSPATRQAAIREQNQGTPTSGDKASIWALHHQFLSRDESTRSGYVAGFKVITTRFNAYSHDTRAEPGTRQKEGQHHPTRRGAIGTVCADGTAVIHHETTHALHHPRPAPCQAATCAPVHVGAHNHFDAYGASATATVRTKHSLTSPGPGWPSRPRSRHPIRREALHRLSSRAAALSRRTPRVAPERVGILRALSRGDANPSDSAMSRTTKPWTRPTRTWARVLHGRIHSRFATYAAADGPVFRRRGLPLRPKRPATQRSSPPPPLHQTGPICRHAADNDPAGARTGRTTCVPDLARYTSDMGPHWSISQPKGESKVRRLTPTTHKSQSGRLPRVHCPIHTRGEVIDQLLLRIHVDAPRFSLPSSDVAAPHYLNPSFTREQRHKPVRRRLVVLGRNGHCINDLIRFHPLSAPVPSPSSAARVDILPFPSTATTTRAPCAPSSSCPSLSLSSRNRRPQATTWWKLTMARSTRSSVTERAYLQFAPSSSPATAPTGAGEEFDESEIWGAFAAPSAFPADPPPSRALPLPLGAWKGAAATKPPVRGGGRAAAHGSLPVNIPDWSKILGDEYRAHHGSAGDWEVDDGDDEDGGVADAVVVPPHELAWRRRRAASLSVHEGAGVVGRTLKVRDAVWKRTTGARFGVVIIAAKTDFTRAGKINVVARCTGLSPFRRFVFDAVIIQAWPPGWPVPPVSNVYCIREHEVISSPWLSHDHRNADGHQKKKTESVPPDGLHDRWAGRFPRNRNDPGRLNVLSGPPAKLNTMLFCSPKSNADGDSVGTRGFRTGRNRPTNPDKNSSTSRRNRQTHTRDRFLLVAGDAPPPREGALVAAAGSRGRAAGGELKMIEVVLNDRLGKKVRVKCNEDDTIGDLKRLVAAQTGTRAEKIRIQKWYTIYKDHITLADYEIHDGMGLELYYNYSGTSGSSSDQSSSALRRATPVAET